MSFSSVRSELTKNNILRFKESDMLRSIFPRLASGCVREKPNLRFWRF